MSSPFALAGPRLRENGFSCLPIFPGGKMPGVYSGGEWRLEHGWSRFCERLPSNFEMGFWERWPDAGVAVALGPASGRAGQILVAADVDTEEPQVVAALMAVLPPSPVRKRGAKGSTLFYRASAAVKNKPFNLGPRDAR